MCAGNQCCPGTAESSFQTFPCPSASPSYQGCGTNDKVEDCLPAAPTTAAPATTSAAPATTTAAGANGACCYPLVAGQNASCQACRQPDEHCNAADLCEQTCNGTWLTTCQGATTAAPATTLAPSTTAAPATTTAAPATTTAAGANGACCYPLVAGQNASCQACRQPDEYCNAA